MLIAGAIMTTAENDMLILIGLSIMGLAFLTFLLPVIKKAKK